MKSKCAADIMTRTVITVGPKVLLLDAINSMLRHNIGSLPVVDGDGQVLGVITEYDIMNFALSGQAADTNVEEAMTPKVISLSPEMCSAVVIELMTSRRIHRVPVVKDGKLVGIISRRDILREMAFMYGKYH